MKWFKKNKKEFNLQEYIKEYVNFEGDYAILGYTEGWEWVNELMQVLKYMDNKKYDLITTFTNCGHKNVFDVAIFKKRK